MTSLWFPTDRPLVDYKGLPRACVLAHAPEGLVMVGVDLGSIPFSSLVLASEIPSVASRILEEQERTKLALGEANVLALGCRRYHLLPDSGTTVAQLELDPVPLSNWVASRNVFAELSLLDRIRYTRDSTLGLDALFGTHLGYTSTVVTSDGYLVVARRQAKLLADGLYDSAIGDTAVAADLVDGKLDLQDCVVKGARRFLGVVEQDIASLKLAMVAVRVDDSGLWVSGHMHLRLTKTELLEAVANNSDLPDPSRFSFVPWSPQALPLALSTGDWTSWGVADLHSALGVDFGVPLQQRSWSSLP